MGPYEEEEVQTLLGGAWPDVLQALCLSGVCPEQVVDEVGGPLGAGPGSVRCSEAWITRTWRQSQPMTRLSAAAESHPMTGAPAETAW